MRALGRPSVDLPEDLQVVVRVENSKQTPFSATVHPPLDLLDVRQEQEGVVGYLLQTVLDLGEGLVLRLLPGIEGEFEARVLTEL